MMGIDISNVDGTSDLGNIKLLRVLGVKSDEQALS